MTDESHGNVIGVGMADIVTERLMAKADWDAAYTNALTSDFLWGIKRPLTVEDDETVRATLARLGIRWRRAKHWITSPDPAYAPKNSAVIG